MHNCLDIFYFFRPRVKPADMSSTKYYKLLHTVNKGEILSISDIEFIHNLPRENLITLLKLYNARNMNINILICEQP